MKPLSPHFAAAAITLLSGALVVLPAQAQAVDILKRDFVTPPATAKPWVYWYFMDGNLSKEGIKYDLDAMNKAGIGGGIYLEVGIGVPQGPVGFMSEQWQDIFKYAVDESKRTGFQIALGTGPGWAGSGGPWVKPEDSMQHMVASETKVSGPTNFDAVLPKPRPRSPFFGEGSMTGQGRKDWETYYEDEVVLAFPTPSGNTRIEGTNEKAVYYRAPYTSQAGVSPRIPAPASFPTTPAGEAVDEGKIINLTGKFDSNGKLTWAVPPGPWTIMRFGRTTTGQTTRPAPGPGLGFESDKFSKQAVLKHMENYTGVLLKKLGPNYRKGNSGLTYIHFDSWEMGAQNWTQSFKNEFQKRRGYDPTPYLPAMVGYVVDDQERSERFLWDLRQTSNELILENHAQVLKDYAHNLGLGFSLEMYDMNPSADLDLGGIGDLPMCEFWTPKYGFGGEFSCFEAVSAAHTNGRNVIGAESFTANPGEDWQQHPWSMKDQLNWALCTGINKFAIHRYQHQPKPGQMPGMSMGPYGVHWEGTQTWWDMVPAFHQYMARTSEMLRKGTPVSDILYLTPEGAPQVFTPPASALTSGFPDKKGYSFDGCSPKNLIANAKFVNGGIQFPGGANYKLLVLPAWETMTPQLLRKIVSLVEQGASVAGAPALKSPSLTNFPQSDAEVVALGKKLWGAAPYVASRKVGKGRVFYNSFKPGAQLQNVKWIWNNVGNPAQSAPVETLYFSKRFDLSGGKTIATALARFSADNTYELKINGRVAGGGDNFNVVHELDVTSVVKAGKNLIEISAFNDGDGPNPAGLMGEIVVTFQDGTSQTVSTDKSWRVAKAPRGAEEDVKELGVLGMGPWGRVGGPSSIYMPYAATASMLKTMGVQQDFTSTSPLRYIHRKLQKGDLYFVANTQGKLVGSTASFRVAGCQPEWWNPVTGESRELKGFTVRNGRTSIPLRLDAYEGGFVIFRKSTTRKSTSVGNFPVFNTAKTLSGPWQVSFDPKWEAPANITFTELQDWSKRPEPAIKYYSGKAVYKSKFDVPRNLIEKNATYAINLGIVKNMASVKVNGKDLGVVWCAPWQAKVPASLLKPTGNQLEVTVANLWINRLIGDENLPVNQRKTETTYRPWRADSPLQPSGLLGPVTLQKAKS